MSKKTMAGHIPTMASVCLAAAAAVSCAVNPVTGERELALISESQEISMGQEAAAQVKNSLGLVDDEALQSYVAGIGQRLAAASERPDLPWEFHVVDDPTPNAFALPGGFIFVTRGLMTLLNSEAELAAVLGHEIGHVTARHSVNQLSRAQLAQIGLGIGAIAAPEEIAQFGDLANTGLSLLFLRYGRDDERQADDLGFRYMHEHGYDVTEMRDVFAALEASSALAGASPVPSWLSSHPSGPERIEALEQRVAALPPNQIGDVTNASQYLNRVDGLAYGANPRHGYFEGNVFYHPDLAFQIEVPANWQRRNTAAALLAASPEGNAAMQLTLAPEPDLMSATAALLQQPGIRELGTSQTRINGNASMVSRFAVDTAQGTIVGVASHIAYGGRIYRVLVYAPSGVSGLARMAERVSGSFAAVDDPAVLNKTVPRLHIIEIATAMSLREFSRRHPSVVPIEEIALVNQVSGPDARLEGNSGVKQVTS